MPSWYNTGTVNVTNGSSAVVGIGTAWINSVIESDAFHGPDGRIYEIAEINSNTSMTLARQYLGDDTTNQKYQIQPTRGLTITLVDKAQSLLSTVQGYVNGVLAGIFKDGTAGSPSIRFANDLAMGIYRKATGVMGFSVGGTERASLSSTAFKIDVPVTGNALQSGPTDSSSGKLLKVGAFGLGGFDLNGVDVPNGEGDLASGFFGGAGSNSDVQTFPDSASRYNPILSLNRLIGNLDYVSVRLFFSGEVPIIRRRSGKNQNWGPYNSLYGTANILNPVSQFGGAPTGGIIERGSNANGEYTRFADGTQICCATKLVSEGQALVFPYPATFVNVPSVSLAGGNGGSERPTGGSGIWSQRYRSAAAAVVSSGSSGTDHWEVTIDLALLGMDGLGGSAQFEASLLAIGRWY